MSTMHPIMRNQMDSKCTVQRVESRVRMRAVSTLVFTRFVQLCTLHVALCAFLVPSIAEASPITYRHDHHLITLYSEQHPTWRVPREQWTYKGIPIKPPSHFRVDGDSVPSLPQGYIKEQRGGWNTEAIAVTLQEKVSSVLNREPGTVTISRNEEEEIVFDGIGLLGRQVDVDRAADLTAAALETGVAEVVLPVAEIQPTMSVLDPALYKAGIREVVTVGESDFAGSPWARRHNIATGLSKFNGHFIEQGEEFSFNAILGPVNQYTGYKEELVILGDRTLPEYGGGLCQVSTTAYRGIWEYGFPISSRRNHSYAVSYYSPQGTDATIYPPHTDMKFINDSPGALLLQTHTEDDKAYFVYYGTRDKRQSEITGPYTWDHRSPPPDRTEYTTEIPPGTTRQAGKKVPGMKSAWYRVVQKVDEEEIVEPYYSTYEARPNFIQIGVADVPSDVPSWIGANSIETESQSSYSSQRGSSTREPVYRPSRRRRR